MLRDDERKRFNLLRTNGEHKTAMCIDLENTSEHTAIVLLMLATSARLQCPGALKKGHGAWPLMLRVSKTTTALKPFGTGLAAGKLIYGRCSPTRSSAMCLSNNTYILSHLEPHSVMICNELVWLSAVFTALSREVLLPCLQGRQATSLIETS
jgi:hypothetical protein